MKSRQFRRRCAVVGAATMITITTAVAPATASAAVPRDGTQDRPCFMIRASWNTAFDGPQPTCPTPTWQLADPADRAGAAGAGETTRAARPAPDVRVVDFMP